MKFWMVHDKIIYTKQLGNTDLFTNPIRDFLSKNNFKFDLQQVADMFSDETEKRGMMKIKDDIAYLPVNGVIGPFEDWIARWIGATSIFSLTKALKNILSDESIKGVFMPFDTPGGSIQGVDEASELIRQIATKKPVFAQVTGEMCSAGYYMGSGATRIYANNRSNFIGSIGTKLILEDDSEMLQNLGIKTIVIDTGDKKSLGESGNPITDEHIEYLQNLVNQMQRWFEESVLAGRPNLAIQEVNDGSLFLAEDAVKKGMIDGIMPMEQAYRRLMMQI